MTCVPNVLPQPPGSPTQMPILSYMYEGPLVNINVLKNINDIKIARYQGSIGISRNILNGLWLSIITIEQPTSYAI